jgi:hypothetical protein
MSAIGDPKFVKSSILDAVRAHLDTLEQEGGAQPASMTDLYTKSKPVEAAAGRGAMERMTDPREAAPGGGATVSVKSSILDAVRAHLDTLEQEGGAQPASMTDLYTKSKPVEAAAGRGAMERMTDPREAAPGGGATTSKSYSRRSSKK